MSQQLFDFTSDLADHIPSLQEAVRTCVTMSKKNRQTIADELHIDYDYLNRMINPNDPAHFPISLLEPLMKVAGNDIPLRYMNDKAKFTDEERRRAREDRFLDALPDLMETGRMIVESRKAEKKERLKAV